MQMLKGVNKRMLTMQNVSKKDETIIELRATKAAVQGNGGVQNVPIILDMINVLIKFHHFYTEYLRQAEAKKSRKKG